MTKHTGDQSLGNGGGSNMSTYLLWVNEERTVLVRWWSSNSMEVCTRSEPAAIWGPPIKVEMEDQRVA